MFSSGSKWYNPHDLNLFINMSLESERYLFKPSPDLPIHDARRMEFYSFSEIPEIVEKYPLDESFVDWLYGLGFIVYYRN